MAELYGLEVGVILTTYDTWDDPPSSGMLGGAPVHIPNDTVSKSEIFDLLVVTWSMDPHLRST